MAPPLAGEGRWHETSNSRYCVDLYLFETNGNIATASIMFLDRVTRLPIGSVQASATLMVSSVGWYHFGFATPVNFVAGGRFAIVFSVTAWGVAYASLGSYSNGQALEKGSVWGSLTGNANLDFAFATWVTPAANPTAQPIPAPTPAPKATPAPEATPKPVASKTPAATQTSVGPSPSTAVASPSEVIASPSTSASASTSPTSSESNAEGKTRDSEGSGGSPILIIAPVIAALALVAITPEGHTGPVSSVAITPDGTRIVSGSDDRTVRVRNLRAVSSNSPSMATQTRCVQ